MSDQASELRARWRSLAPFLREEIIRTGRSSEAEANWIAVHYARMSLGRVRRRMWIVIIVFMVVLGVALGLLRSTDVVNGVTLPLVTTVITLPFVLALFAWARGQVIAFSRIITMNEAAPESVAPVSVRPGWGERLDVRIVLGRVIVRFGGIALVLALVGALMAGIGAHTSTIVVCETGAGVILAMLLWIIVRARRHDPMVRLSEEGVTVAGWGTTVPWGRVTGIRVVTPDMRRGVSGSHILALSVDAPEQLIGGLSGAYAKSAQRSLSAYGTPVSFSDRYTDTTAHAVASAASTWTGLPVRST
ncbi:hypothetical protein [Actinomadura oligospora]|uniref:hypothetical protein n=1 Tax=Actinomadura oligospora TaxID=111804 RepID=UPI00047CF236|nr:hypothetical protein [Actinomadura oligospora]